MTNYKLMALNELAPDGEWYFTGVDHDTWFFDCASSAPPSWGVVSFTKSALSNAPATMSPFASTRSAISLALLMPLSPYTL